MGNVVGTVPNLNLKENPASNFLSRYEREELVARNETLIFDQYNGHDKETGMLVSIFHFSLNNESKKNLISFARNAVAVSFPTNRKANRKSRVFSFVNRNFSVETR
jgi:prenyltransferase beta subunit